MNATKWLSLFEKRSREYVAAPPGYVSLTNMDGDGGFLVPEEATPLVEAMMARGDLVLGETVDILIPAEEPKPDCVVQT